MWFHAIINAHKQWSKCDGRASRAEYGWFCLYYILVHGVMCLDVACGLSEVSWLLFVVLIIYSLFLAQAGLSLTFRRLKDAGKSWWWLLLLLSVIFVCNAVGLVWGGSGDCCCDPITIYNYAPFVGSGVMFFTLLMIGFLKSVPSEQPEANRTCAGQILSWVQRFLFVLPILVGLAIVFFMGDKDCEYPHCLRLVEAIGTGGFELLESLCRVSHGNFVLYIPLVWGYATDWINPLLGIFIFVLGI